MAFTVDIIQDTFQGVFFTKFGIILLILKLFRACRMIHTRALYTTMRIFLKGSDLTLIEDYIIQLWENKLNNRILKCLNWKTSYEVF